MNSRQSDEEVAQDILGYLAEHPRAMDTAEGIAEWWIMRQQIRVNVAALTRVLRGMTERGLLEEIGTGERRRYRLRHSA
jgi:DNA-binding IclR family transcriptional regulator